MIFLENIKFDDRGLVPAIVQDIHTREVLMMAYMNRQSVTKTMATNQTWFFSRSRDQLWNKGETSGNYQSVKRISYDCDGDTLLVEVQPVGPACHTGERSCFYRQIKDDKTVERMSLDKLYTVIEDRHVEMPKDSYTTYLFEKGIDKILKKVGEEASEVIIASKNEEKTELVGEIADLAYHMLVLMVEQGVGIEEVEKELARRHKG